MKTKYIVLIFVLISIFFYVIVELYLCYKDIRVARVLKKYGFEVRDGYEMNCALVTLSSHVELRRLLLKEEGEIKLNDLLLYNKPAENQDLGMLFYKGNDQKKATFLYKFEKNEIVLSVLFLNYNKFELFLYKLLL